MASPVAEVTIREELASRKVYMSTLALLLLGEVGGVSPC